MKSLVALVLAAAVAPAFAGLGGRPVTAGDTSVQPMASASGATWRQQTSRLDSGTVVRQFINTDGVVFAVSWSGPFLPDLRELLGPHFDALRQVESGGGRGRTSSLSISRPDLVLVSAGHMGAFEGRAYLPGQLPAGFDPGSIQ